MPDDRWEVVVGDPAGGGLAGGDRTLDLDRRAVAMPAAGEEAGALPVQSRVAPEGDAAFHALATPIPRVMGSSDALSMKAPRLLGQPT